MVDAIAPRTSGNSLVTMAPGTSNIQLLAALVDIDDDEESEYRFLVDNKHVKYVTTEPGVLPGVHRTFGPDVIQALPEFSPGEWIEGRVAKNDHTGKPYFSSTSTAKLPSVECIWHPTTIDHLELKELDRLRQNIHKVSHSSFGKPVIFKFAVFPWQIQYLEAETQVYQWIQDKGIEPKFLGHVSEGGRVVGFLIEYIDGASTAVLGDLEACGRTLAQLHALGIRHGDVNKHNFLVQQDKVTIIDFETAKKCDDEQLRKELADLRASFEDQSQRGGVIIAG